MNAREKFLRRPLRPVVQKSRNSHANTQFTLTDSRRATSSGKKITLATAGKQKTQDVSRISPKAVLTRLHDTEIKETERCDVKIKKSDGKSVADKKSKPSKSSRKTKNRVNSAGRRQVSRSASNKTVDDQATAQIIAESKSSNPAKASRDRLNTLTPFVDEAKIDGLAVAVHVRSEFQEAILWAARDLQNHEEKYLPKLEMVPGKPGTRFRHKFIVRDKESKFIGYIYFSPVQRDKQIAFFQFKFNPSKISDKQRLQFVRAIKILLGEHARELLAVAKINQIDLAFDVHGLPKTALLTYSIRVGRTGVWGKWFRNGDMVKMNIETTYHGQKLNSPRSITVYDKRQEQKDVGNTLQYDHDCVRIESRVKPRIVRHGYDGKKTTQYGAYLFDLRNIQDPFGNFQIAARPIPRKGDWEFDVFLSATDAVGVDAALAKVKDDNVRRRFRKRLADARVDWWDPSQAMNSAIEALKKLDLFPLDAFDEKPFGKE
jgi:hypothetical protein